MQKTEKELVRSFEMMLESLVIENTESDLPKTKILKAFEFMQACLLKSLHNVYMKPEETES